MLVHIIADSWNKIAELETAFSGRCKVSAAMLGGRTEMHEACDAVVVAANLRIVDNITQLKKLQPKIEAVRRRFFVVDEKAHLSAVQAYALGATRVVFGSARADLLSLLNEHDQRAPLHGRQHRPSGNRLGGRGELRLDVSRGERRARHRCRGC